MSGNCEATDVEIKEATVETKGSIGTIERYHDPLRLAFDCKRIDMNPEESISKYWNRTVSAVNCTLGPEELAPCY